MPSPAVMPVDGPTLERVRRALGGRDDVVERAMMGARCFMVGGAMCCGVRDATLMVRVGQDGYAAALAEPHVCPMDVGGRAPKGFVRVDPAGFRTEAALAAWIDRGLAVVAALPARPPRGTRGARSIRR